MKKFIKLTDSEAQSAIKTIIPNFNPDNESIAEIIWAGYSGFFYMTENGKLYKDENLIGTFVAPGSNPDSDGRGLVMSFDIVSTDEQKPLFVVTVFGIILFGHFLWSPLTDEYINLGGDELGSYDIYDFLSKPPSENKIRVFAFQKVNKRLSDTRCFDVDTNTLEVSKINITGVSDNSTKFIALFNICGENKNDLDNAPFYLFVTNDDGGLTYIDGFDNIDVNEEGILTINHLDFGSLPSYNPTNKYFSATGSTLLSLWAGLLGKSEEGTFFRNLSGDGSTDIEVLDTNDDLKEKKYFLYGKEPENSCLISSYTYLEGQGSANPLIFVCKEPLKITGVNSNFGYTPTNTFPHELEQYRITKVQFVSQQDNQLTLKFTGDIGTENLIIYYNPAAEIPSVDYITINGVKIPKGQEVEVNIFEDFSIILGGIFSIKFKKKDGTIKTYSAVKFVKKDGTSKTYTKVRFDKA